MGELSVIPEPVDFIGRYLNYIGESEAPVVFHRWSALGGLGAWLGKSVWFEHGGFKIYPNLYIQLFGLAGSRKSTSIKRMTSLLKQAGYADFSVEKTSKEKFIEWLSSRGQLEEGDLWSGLDMDGSSTNALIAADEFTDFFSTNILDFLSFLGVMWDYEGQYEHSTRAGGSVVINNPCISILSGNTPTMLAKTIPPEAIGQGFFSRTIVVYGEETGIKIAFPVKPSEAATAAMIDELKELRAVTSGPMSTTEEALAACEEIYVGWHRLTDPRFEGYGNRRFNQLLKLSIIHAIAAHSDVIDVEHVVRANTVLTRAEKEMAKALGEFGTSKNAAVIHKITRIIETTRKPLSISDIWAHVHTDLDRVAMLSEILSGLLHAGKIQSDDQGRGLLPIKHREELVQKSQKWLNWDYLSEQERAVIF